MLVPKYALNGFYFDDDQIDIFEQVKTYALKRNPEDHELANQAKNEMIQFVSKVSSLNGTQKETVMQMDGKTYWSILGRREFPKLFEVINAVNLMNCSSAASERVWSIYKFIHSRLRNRLSNEKVQKLIFLYINCAILDKNDSANYFEDLGLVLDEFENNLE
jgi:hypothetical protein